MSANTGFGAIRRAFSNRDYAVYATGNAVSLIGHWMQRVAVGWLAWDLTGSAAWLGAIAFADLFPAVLIGPIAGAVADRRDRLRIMRLGQALACVQAFALYALTQAGLMTAPLLLALSLLLGIVNGFIMPARLALIPALVRRDDLSSAVALNSVIFNLARFIGPAAAGPLIAAGGTATVFAANGITFLWFLVALSRIRPRPDPTAARGGHGGLISEIGEGVLYVARHPGIGPLMLLLLIGCLGVRPMVELLPGFAGAVFEIGAEGLALLTSTLGLGAVVGGLWLAGRADTAGLVRIVLGFTALFTLALALFVATTSLWLALPALFLLGTGMVVAGVGSQTLLQLSVEPGLRGRVLALYGIFFRGGPALGALAIGAVADAAGGLRWPLAVGAAVTLAATGWVWLRRNRLVRTLEDTGKPLGGHGKAPVS